MSPPKSFLRSVTQAVLCITNKRFLQRALTKGMKGKELRVRKFDVRGSSRGNPGDKKRVGVSLWWETLQKRYDGNFLIL
jgi:hypothetical protein